MSSLPRSCSAPLLRNPWGNMISLTPTAVADRVALTIGDAVSTTAGEPVAAARVLVSQARDRRDLHSPRHLAIARPLTRNYPQLRSLMLKMRNPQLRKLNSKTAVRQGVRKVEAQPRAQLRVGL